MHCDASSDDFGGILFQKQDDNRIHPIAYFGRIAPSTRNIGSHLNSLRKFRIHLEGILLKIITNCNSLTMTPITGACIC